MTKSIATIIQKWGLLPKDAKKEILRDIEKGGPKMESFIDNYASNVANAFILHKAIQKRLSKEE